VDRGRSLTTARERYIVTAMFAHLFHEQIRHHGAAGRGPTSAQEASPKVGLGRPTSTGRIWRYGRASIGSQQLIPEVRGDDRKDCCVGAHAG
jgi:hypothetical protein